MGPFVFPSQLNIASVVVYLECKQKDLIQKPISLSMHHFIFKGKILLCQIYAL